MQTVRLPFKEAHFCTVLFISKDLTKGNVNFFSNFSPCRATDSVSPHMKKERASWTGGGGGEGGLFFGPDGSVPQNKVGVFF